MEVKERYAENTKGFTGGTACGGDSVLELLPYGAVLHFANGFGGTIRETFSYFSFIPFGYANFGPLCTAVLSCLLLGLAAVYLLSGKGRPILRIVSVAAFAVSLTPRCWASLLSPYAGARFPSS